MSVHAVRPVWGPDERPRKVLLVGNYGNGNAGDEAILAGLLTTVGPHADVTVLSRGAREVRALHGVAAVGTLSWAGVRAYARADRVVVGGGGMFGSGLPPLVALLPFVLLVSRLLGKQVAFVAIGAYEDTPRPVRAALQWAARAADCVTVRDAESARVLGRWTRVQPTVVGDPATLVEDAPDQVLARHVPAGLLASRPLVVSLKAMPELARLESLLDLLGRALAGPAAERVPVVLLCMSRKTDYGLLDDVSDAALADRFNRDHLDGAARVLGPDLPPRVVKSVVGAARGVISMRLHPQIFASTSGVPQLPVVFEPKSAAWCAFVGIPAVPSSQLVGADVTRWVRELDAA